MGNYSGKPNYRRLGYATPSVYAVDGKQFVVIAAGGGKTGTKSGDAYLAFSLPEE